MFPTPIEINSEEQLIIQWALYKYYPENPIVGEVGGYDYSISAFQLNGSSWDADNGISSTQRIALFDESGGQMGGVINGSLTGPYIPDSFTSEYRWSVPVNAGNNAPIKYLNIYFSSGTFRVELTPSIIKNNQQRVNITASISVNRV